MKILQRYILQELWLPFLMSFATLNFIFLAGYLVRAANFIIGRGVPLWETLYALALAMPDMISYTAPTSLLTAVMIVFGNLSQSNEIRAMKASGVHPFLIMTPAFLVGLGLSVGMFVFNDQIATNAAFQLRRVTKQMLIRHPAAMIEPGRFVKLSDTITFLTKELHGDQMRDIVAYENEATEKPIRSIIAERGELLSTQNKSQLKIRLYDGSISDAEDASVQSIQFKSYEFPTLGSDDLATMEKKMRERSLAELVMHSSKPDLKKREVREVWSAFHQRISFSLGSFIFVFIGIPIAILVRRGEIVLSFGIAMAAASLYYVLFLGAKTLCLQAPVLPEFLVSWIPNILLLALGVKLIRRAFVA